MFLVTDWKMERTCQFIVIFWEQFDKVFVKERENMSEKRVSHDGKPIKVHIRPKYNHFLIDLHLFLLYLSWDPLLHLPKQRRIFPTNPICHLHNNKHTKATIPPDRIVLTYFNTPTTYFPNITGSPLTWNSCLMWWSNCEIWLSLLLAVSNNMRSCCRVDVVVALPSV